MDRKKDALKKLDGKHTVELEDLYEEEAYELFPDVRYDRPFLAADLDEDIKFLNSMGNRFPMDAEKTEQTVRDVIGHINAVVAGSATTITDGLHAEEAFETEFICMNEFGYSRPFRQKLYPTAMDGLFVMRVQSDHEIAQHECSYGLVTVSSKEFERRIWDVKEKASLEKEEKKTEKTGGLKPARRTNTKEDALTL